jgi:hypothetical protein
MQGGRRTAVLAAVVAGATMGLIAAPASAARRPTGGEKAAIKRVAMRACDPAPGCRFRQARVSTRNARYAWADVVGEGFSAVLLKRPSPRSRSFKVVGTQGGGIGLCSYWRARAPAAVLHDLHVNGLLDDESTTARCG